MSKDEIDKSSQQVSPHFGPDANKDAHMFKIIGFILPFAGMSIPGLIFSIIAYRQLKPSGEKYKLALAGIWVGAGLTFLTLIYFVFFGYLFLTRLH